MLHVTLDGLRNDRLGVWTEHRWVGSVFDSEVMAWTGWSRGWMLDRRYGVVEEYESRMPNARVGSMTLVMGGEYVDGEDGSE